MNFQTIKLVKHDNDLWQIVLNRPEVHNAFNAQMIIELTEAFDLANTAVDCRFILLTSSSKIFCAGADLQWMQAAQNYTHAENQRDAMALANMLNKIDKCSKPTIAIVTGGVFGGGVGLISVCDIVIGTDDTSLCLSEVKLGLIPAVISPFVIRAIGARQARRYFLTAEKITADAALQMGLLHIKTSVDQLSDTLNQTLNYLTNGSPEAQAAGKQLIDDCESNNISDELLENLANQIAHIRTSTFAQEGMYAFFEKRKPSWYKETMNVKLNTHS